MEKTTKTNNYKKGKGNKNGKRGKSIQYNQDNKNKKDETLLSDQGDKSSTKVMTNSPEWYKKIPHLANLATRIKCGYPLGIENNFNNEHFSCDSKMLGVNKFPGVMAFDLLYGPGKCLGTADHITRAMDQIFRTLRQAKQGRSTRYDPQDMFMYLNNVADIKVLYEVGVRALGLINGRSNTYANLYEYKAIFQAIGWDYRSLLNDKELLIKALNEFCLALSEFRVPTEIDYYKRIENIFKFYYVDDSSVTSQIYLFRPYGYRVMNPYSETGTQLDFKRMPQLLTVEKYIELLEEVIDVLRNNSDMHFMCGEILYAFKGCQPIISQISPDYTIPGGVVDPYMLQQIRNLTILGAPNWESCNITQDPSIGQGHIIYNPKFDGRTDGAEYHHMIYSDRLYTIDGSPEQASDGDLILEATRLMNIPVPCDPTTEWHGFYELETMGVEVCVGACIYTFVPGQWEVLREDQYKYEFNIETYSAESTYSDLINAMTKMTLLTKFRNHPSVYYTVTSRGECVEIYNADDVNTYGIITRPNLNDLHKACMLSLWNCETPFDFYEYKRK